MTRSTALKKKNPRCFQFRKNKYANICFKTWFLGQKTRFSDLTISRWSVVSEVDFIQIIKITPGPHLRDNKTIVVEFLYTRNTSLTLTLRYDLFFVHEFTLVHFLHDSINKIFWKYISHLAPTWETIKLLWLSFFILETLFWICHCDITNIYSSAWIYFSTFLHHGMKNIEFHFICITNILYDFNNIQHISPLRRNSFKEEVRPKPKLGMFSALPQNNHHWF